MNNAQRSTLQDKVIDALMLKLYDSYDLRFEAITEGRIGVYEMTDPELLALAIGCYGIDISAYQSEPEVLSDTHKEVVAHSPIVRLLKAFAGLRNWLNPDSSDTAALAQAKEHARSVSSSLRVF